MASILIKDLPPALLRALQVSAKKNGRSLQAEATAILEGALMPERRIKLGSELAAFGDKYGLALQVERDKTPVMGTKFE